MEAQMLTRLINYRELLVVAFLFVPGCEPTKRGERELILENWSKVSISLIGNLTGEY